MRCFLTCVLLVTLCFFAGCTYDDTLLPPLQETPVIPIATTTVSLIETQEPSDTPAKTDNDVSEEDTPFQSLLEKGRYPTHIRLGGEERDPRVFKVSENHLVFPESVVLTLLTENLGTQQALADLSSDEIKSFIKRLESAECSYESIDAHSTVGSYINIVLLNTSAEYIRVVLLIAEDNQVICVAYHESGEFEVYALTAPDLGNEVKEMCKWSIVDRADIEDIRMITVKNLNTDQHISLGSDMVNAIVISLAKGESFPGETSPKHLQMIFETGNGKMYEGVYVPHDSIAIQSDMIKLNGGVGRELLAVLSDAGILP